MVTPFATVCRFQSTHPVRGGTIWIPLRYSLFQISIHPPRAGWDHIFRHSKIQQSLISIHPPRAGWDLTCGRNPACRRNFNPPTPCGVGRQFPSLAVSIFNFNPPTPCGVGLPCTPPQFDTPAISIHPPRAGWDCGECPGGAPGELFQSTHPVRGGTANIANVCNKIYNISNKIQ